MRKNNNKAMYLQHDKRIVTLTTETDSKEIVMQIRTEIMIATMDKIEINRSRVDTTTDQTKAAIGQETITIGTITGVMTRTDRHAIDGKMFS